MRTSDAAEDNSGASVPAGLATVAAWSWRLIVIGAVVYFLAQVVAELSFVVVPCVIALLLTAALYPLTDRLRRLGLPSLAAVWLTTLAALGVLGGVGVLIGVRANAEFPKLLDQLQQTSRDFQGWLVSGPLHLKQAQLEKWVEELLKQVDAQRSSLVNTVVTGAAVAFEMVAGIIFMLFATFFLLKDGPQIWAWAIRALGRHRTRVDQAGRAAWTTLSQYVHGTVMVAAVHAVVMAIVLTVMEVPLVAPLTALIFFASFIPIVGILIAGGVAVLVVFSAKGVTAMLIFLGILIVEQQLENHLLQPLVVGRWVRFHPLAIMIVLAAGGVLGGIPGAAVAVPAVAALYRAWPALRGHAPALEPELATAGLTRSGAAP